MSNPHSPEPARWILEMFAPDIPAWNRAFNEVERKPLSALEDMLVHSFDRYLRRKGYLTKEQVEVLQGIAIKHNVPLPPIPPIARHTESSHTKQELNPRSALFQEIKNPLELEEAEVVKPEVIARWRTFLPDRIIRELVEQRRWVREARRVEEWVSVPDFAFSMPRLPEIERKAEVFAMGIDADGWVEERFWGKDKIGEIDRTVWKYEYETPEIGFATDNLQLTKKIANMLIANITPIRPQPPRALRVMYETITYTERATRAILLAEPYLLKWRERADKILEKYREHPTKRLPRLSQP